MAATAEDLARLVVSIELSQAKVEKQAAAIAKSAERAANNIDGNFARANANVGKSFERSAKTATVSVGQTKAAVTNLTFQLNDIAQGLMSGTSPFTIMAQQGSQVSQALSSAGGGALGAVRALGGAFAGMVNPVSLATFAIIGLGGAAVQYFVQMLSDSADSEKTLKEQAELIGKVADKWGDALPALKAYNDEKKKLQDKQDLEGATEAAVSGEYADLRKIIKDINVDLVELISKLQAAGTSDGDVVKLQQAFGILFEDVKKGDASVEHLRNVQAGLTELYNNSHIPAAKEMADAIGRMADEFERAAAAGQKLRADTAIQDFFSRSSLGGLTPLTSDGGNFLNPQQQQDYTAGHTKSQFELELDKAGGAIESFVDRVVKAESGGNSNAKNPNSSATGAGQFIASTWLDLFKRYFPDRAEGMTRGAILALRSDANVSRSLIEAYAKENAAVLQSAGVHVDEAALQLAHFLGAGDAAKVLSAASGTPLAGLISAASIRANPTILGGGATVNDAISYANNRASGSGSSGGKSKKSPDDIFAGNMQQIQARIALLNAEYEAQSKLNPAINDYGFAVEKARIKQQLLNDAAKAGVKITPELAAQIDALAGNYAKASAAGDQLRASQEQLSQKLQESSAFGKDVLGGFIQDMKDGKSATEALAGALNKVADKLLDIGLNALFDGIGGQAGGGGGLLGGLFSFLFAKGGVAAHGKPVPLKRFAGGGTSNTAAIFGEAGPEAAVPLPDGRRIPVDLRGPTVPNGAKGSTDVVRVVLQDDSGRMSEIADSRIQTHSGTIVQVAVEKSQKATKANMPGYLANAQSRQL
ncbi:phage tail length tape measure family protein [Mesorhizobium sp. BR1-1-3]|uniref:phage tail length tape measure family protein n=1 Tax=Mesorhizobium sp. BR1-1-3 TaxID=2876651 RepID=UPI001CD0583D|nr:phage tail length tape measure family protein [Mesorhizobium sp. BR1-1-3]MBZ9888128.1 phage tail length tape measure family protein [Mesorhizobium sp. BR1-1-3]